MTPSSRSIDVAGVRLHITRWGQPDRPPVVLTHGITDDAGCLAALARQLATDHHVVAVDARGHGRSDAPAAGYAARDHLRDLAGVIEALALDRPTVIGHSMGATTTLALAAHRPDLVRAAVLEDPPAWWTNRGQVSELQRAGTLTMQATLRALKRRTANELRRIQAEVAPSWSDEELAAWVDATLRLSPTVGEELTASLDANAALDWPGLLATIDVPVLLLTGDPERGAIVTPAAAAGFRALVDHAEVVHLPGAGHSLRREQPTAYLGAVRSFLAAMS